MGILEELVMVRDSLEKSNKSNNQIAREVGEITDKYHLNLIEMYQNEQYEDFKKSFIAMMMALSSLTDMIFYEDGGVNLQETLFVVTPVCFILEKAHKIIRDENGLKILESLTLVLSKLLKKYRRVEFQNKAETLVGFSVMSQVLTAIESYKRKSFRELYTVPEFNFFSKKILDSLTNDIEKGDLKLSQKLLQNIGTTFETFDSLYQYEDNYTSIIGATLKKLIEVIKKKVSQNKKKGEKGATDLLVTVLPNECKNSITIRRHPFCSKSDRKNKSTASPAQL